MLDHGVRELTYAAEEGVVAHGTVVFDVDGDSGSLVILCEEDAVQKKLEVIQGLLAVSDETPWIIGPDLQGQMPFPLLFLDFHDETEMCKDAFQNFSGGLVHRL